MSFGNGGFRFGDMSHQGSLLVLPSGMRAWDPLDIADLTATHVIAIAEEANEIDFLLFGTGSNMQQLPKSAVDCLVNLDMPHDVMSTSSAIHVYNVVLGERRRVAAALIAVKN